MNARPAQTDAGERRARCPTTAAINRTASSRTGAAAPAVIAGMRQSARRAQRDDRDRERVAPKDCSSGLRVSTRLPL